MNPYFTKNIGNSKVTRRRPNPIPKWVYLSIILGCFITYGFVLAAQARFNAIGYGYKSEDLKKQRVQLEVAQRKLTLELQRRTSPKKLDSRAQQQGLTLPQSHAEGQHPQTSAD